MREVQKNTYLSIILSDTYADSSFKAKSITLDFLFGFQNPYTAIVTLNECLNENNRLAKMGLNCIYGVLLAVKEYREFYPTTIIHEYIKTLINAITYKVDDTRIEHYQECMEKILEFIAENIDFKLIILFFELADIFSFYDGHCPDREVVFNKYCSALDFACKKLAKKDLKLLCYNLMPIKVELGEIELDKNNILRRVNDILLNIYKEEQNELLIVSNLVEGEKTLVNNLQKEYSQINVNFVDRKDLNNIQQISNLRVLFLIDFKSDDYNELIYLFGKMEERLEQNQLLAVFHNCEIVGANLFYQALIDRYACENNKIDKMNKFLQ